MSREKEVADYLRSDTALVALVPGGIYPDAALPNPEGLTHKKLTKVWANGVFNTTIVVRQGAAVPTGDLQSTRTQRTSMSQRIAIYAYSDDTDAIEAALNQVYTLMMGKRLTAAFSATQAGGGPGIVQAPELPPGIKQHNEDYRIVFIRRPVTA